MDSERNRPAELQNDPAEVVVTPEMVAMSEEYRQACEAGMPPEQVADHVFQAIAENKFYILTHPEYTPFVQVRMEAIVQERNPVPLPG
jgi:hypothetical protein